MLGATGFVGRAVPGALVAAGHRVRVLARNPARAALAQPGVEVVGGDGLDQDGLRRALDGMDAAVSLMAVRRNRPQPLALVNIEGAQRLAMAAVATGVSRIVFVSAIGAAPDPRLKYLSSRWMGEEEVRRSGLDATVLRFSFVLGDDGGIIDDFAKAVAGPVAIVPGSGRIRTQPIIREDAARCIAAALADPKLVGVTLDVGGPEILTYNQLFQLWLDARGIRKPVVHMPIPLIFPGAAAMEALLPNPMIVPDELRTIQRDNVAESVDVIRRVFGFDPQAPSRWAPAHWGRG